MSPARSPRTAPTREKLFAAAIELIAEQGFSSTSVDQIAERAGVAKGTVYYNFPSKAALFEALLEHGVGLLSAGFQEAIKDAGPSAAEQVSAIVRRGLDAIERNPAFFRLLLSEMFRTNRVWQQSLRLVRQEAIGVIETVISDGVARGELRGDIEPGLAASALFGMILVVTLDWITFQPQRSLEDVHATVMNLMRERLTTQAVPGEALRDGGTGG